MTTTLTLRSMRSDPSDAPWRAGDVAAREWRWSVVLGAVAVAPESRARADYEFEFAMAKGRCAQLLTRFVEFTAVLLILESGAGLGVAEVALAARGRAIYARDQPGTASDPLVLWTLFVSKIAGARSTASACSSAALSPLVRDALATTGRKISRLVDLAVDVPAPCRRW